MHLTERRTYGTRDTQHAETCDVTLFLLSLKDQHVRAVATLLGGQETIDVPSWSPDRAELAFVSYSFLASDVRATRR
jgi:hypothetical protein